jgi:hypothetical protein
MFGAERPGQVVGAQLDAVAQPPPEEGPAGQAVLALISQWWGLLEEARARESEWTDRLIAAEATRARVEGELEAVKAAQARPWYRRLFGG